MMTKRKSGNQEVKNEIEQRGKAKGKLPRDEKLASKVCDETSFRN